MTGFVRKGIGGFYYVEADGTLYTCTARGRFRKERISPYAGDRVRITVESNKTGSVEAILPRKNFLARPPLANLDRLLITCSMREPFPDLYVIDKTVAAVELAGIEPVIVLTKADLENTAGLESLYRSAGISCLTVSSVTGEGVKAVRELLWGKVSAFTGNSGVGKSSLLNAMFPEFELKTGEISQKLGRGRHTTREVELYKIGPDSYVADTPGFSTVDIERYQITDKEQLVYGFREFIPCLGECQFSSCSHTCEKGCAVLRAVEEGKIAKSRHDSYRAMYEEIKDVKAWQLKNGNV